MNQLAGFILIFMLSLQTSSCNNYQPVKQSINDLAMSQNNYDTITLGAGCFWCVEALFQQLKGVQSVESGYSGGHVINPTYKEVCTGTTNHAEVCQVTYDRSVISFTEILEVFWKTHDPTTLNRQGADIGTQYRSAIFYHTGEQRQIAEEMKARLDAAGIWNDPVVTEIVPFDRFFKAEAYHQEYYFQNTSQPYCSAVITPKLEKFKKVFSDKLKEK